jgi:ketosteroid isomerase-like protein
MEAIQTADSIREAAKDLDDALETRDIDTILPFFADDCEIELLGVRGRGREGVRKWLEWQYRHVAKLELVPVVIMIEGNVFFEEFVAKARLHDGSEVESKQAEVLVYENNKVTSLRLYFDRLDFANAVAKGFVSKFIVRRLISMSVAGLE